MKTILFLTLFALVFVSCTPATQITKQDTPPPPASRPVDIPSPVGPQLERERRIEIVGPSDLFSFSLREADVKDVLRAIAQQSHYNVVVEPGVKGACTVDLKNVTLRKALDYILEPLECSYTIDEKTIYVSKVKIETKLFVLNYIAMKKTGTSTLRGSINLGGGGSGGVTGTTGTSGTTSGTTGGGRATEVLTMRSDSETDMWKDIESHIKEMLSKDGKYVMNRVASTIVVSDFPKHLKNITLYLESIEGVIQRQVMIEAKIVEVELSESQSEGVNWRLISARIGEFRFDNTELVTRAPSILFPITKDAIPVTTDVLGNIVGQSPSILNPPFFRFGVSNANFESFIELLKTQGKTKIISSPKIATLNNQRAIIKVAREDVAFETTTTIASGSPAQTSSIVRYVTIGLMLDVMPQIDGKGNIILNVHPVLTEKVGEQVSKTGDASAPVIDVRETDTMVRMKDGETLIIGGLIKDREKKSESGVPGLMNLPIIGKFFKMKEVSTTRNELVIFLTPRIIYGSEN
jgi:MSHA biogenesis protein MshL